MIKLLALVLLSFALPLAALNEYYSIARSTRSLGMGGAFYALSEAENALFYNPAGLAFHPAGWSVRAAVQGGASLDTITKTSTLLSVFDESKGLSDVIDTIEQMQGRPLAVQTGGFFSYLNENWGLGLLALDSKANLAFLGTELNAKMDVSAISDSGLLFGWGNELDLIPGMKWGMGIKFLFRVGGSLNYTAIDSLQSLPITTNADQMWGHGAGIDADLGIMYGFPLFLGRRLEFAVSINNLAATRFPWLVRAEGTPPLVRTLNVGTLLFLGNAVFLDSLTVLMDVTDTPIGNQSASENVGGRAGNFSKHIHLGLEVRLKNRWYLRTGLHQGYPTAGLGYRTTHLSIDLAFYTEEIGKTTGQLNSDRIALSIALDWGTKKKGTLPQRHDPSKQNRTATPGPEPEHSEKDTQESILRQSVTITSHFDAQLGVRFGRSEKRKPEAYPSIC